MEQLETFLIFTERLERARLRYMVTGSIAAMVYGYPRFTADLDLVVELSPLDIDAVLKAFPLEEFYCPPREVLLIESKRRQRGHFNIIHHETGYKADIYVYGEDPLHKWGLAKASLVQLAEYKAIRVAPPEYVIVRKLEYFKEGGSEKHVQDIKGMLEVSSEKIDLELIKQLVAERQLQIEWEQILNVE